MKNLKIQLQSKTNNLTLPIGAIPAMLFQGMIIVFLGWQLSLVSQAATNQAIFVSSNRGSDTTDCGAQTSPCKTLQHAVELAQSEDILNVAAGTYTFSNDACGRNSVICIRNKNLTLQGGFSSNDWSGPNPAANPTIIDGENAHRGIDVLGTNPDPNSPSSQLTMSGFTVQNGLAQGGSSGVDGFTFAFGGGMLVDYGYIALSNMRFINNQALGGDTTQSYGGAGAGGAIAIRNSTTADRRINLQNIEFVSNQAHGGDGQDRGGFGIGGGLFTYQTFVFAKNLIFTNNQSSGGNAVADGVANGERGDGQGGALGIQLGSDVILQNLTVKNNVTRGGNAGGEAGGSFGGGLFAENAVVTLSNSTFSENQSIAGNGQKGGVANGGGIDTFNSSIDAERIFVVDNQAISGSGSQSRGISSGGGILIVDYNSNPARTARVSNSVIANNAALMGSSGGVSISAGGGLWVQGITAQLSHLTIVNNRVDPLSNQGAAIIVINTGAPPYANVSLSYSIIADHQTDNSQAIFVTPGNTINLNRGLLVNNRTDTNKDSGYVGTINGLELMEKAASVGFSAPDDYRLTLSSPAVDKASGSTETIDILGDSRRNVPDIGAYEATVFNPAAAALPGNRIVVYWGSNPGISSYRVTVHCPDQASSPREIACSASDTFSASQTQLQLNGLTLGQEYSFDVEALDSSNSVLASKTISAMVVDKFAYLPLVVR